MENKNCNNQSLNSHMLFFDPINRKVTPMPNVIPKKGEAPKAPGPAHRANAEFTDVPGVRTLPDGKVEVTFYAPNAHTVELRRLGTEKGYFMEKIEDGYWRVVIEDLEPGFHYHHYYVDGVQTVNPTIPFGYGCSEVINYLDVPYPDQDYYLLKQVPHGTLHMELIYSQQAERYRNAWVYTPPAYEQNPDKRYPVMYIQHGGGENEMGWFWQGKLNYIADNLLAEGKCKEMIIVCCAGYSIKRLENGNCLNLDYTDAMINEIVPFIDSKYRTIADREYRAMAGLSMGGGQARIIAHRHPEVFANLGQFSCGGGFVVKGDSLYGPADYSELFATPEHYNSLMKLTFITCGTEDPRDAYTSVQVKELADQGYNVEYHTYPGDHEWNAWRPAARDFMMKLFR